MTSTNQTKQEISLKTFVRRVVTVLVCAPLGIVVTANVEKLAQDRKWDTFLTTWWPTMLDLSPLLEQRWFWFVFGILAATAALLWADKLIRREPNPIDTDLEFFATIDDLRTKHPLPEIFKPGNEIHAYFLSGEGVFGENRKYMKCVKRLILPSPDAPSLDRFITRPGSADFRTQISRSRDMARENDSKSVRLYKDFTGASLLFCNPDKQDGWVQVGIVIPETEPAERQHYRLYKAKQEKAFLSLYKTFDRLWDTSCQSTEEEDMQEAFDRETRVTRPILEIKIANVLSGEEIIFEGQDGAIQTCYLEIHNTSSEVDAEDVEVKVETYDQIPDLLQPRVQTQLLARANVSLMFENGGYARTISRNERKNVRFVMYQKNPPKRWIQIGEYTANTFDRRNKIVSETYEPHRLDLTIRAKNIRPIQKSFVVQAENDLLTVRMLE